MRRGLEWTAERVGTLRDLWDKGTSAAQIACTIGHGVSKQAVLTKAYSIGLRGRRRPSRKKVLRGKVGDGGMALGIARRIFTPKEVDTRYLNGPAWDPLPGTAPVGLMDLPDTRFVMCRWPVHGGYCGQPSGAETYCEIHRKIAFQQTKAAK